MRVGGRFFEPYLQENFKLLLITLLLFAAGIVAGGVYGASVPSTAEAQLEGIIGGHAGQLTATDCMRVFTASFLNLLQLWIWMSLCGTSCIGLLFAPFFMLVRGFLCGFGVATLLVLYGARGIGAAAVGMLPQQLVLLPAMQLLCVAAIRQAQSVTQTLDRVVRRNRFFGYCAFCLVLLCVFALAALYEGYIGWRCMQVLLV